MDGSSQDERRGNGAQAEDADVGNGAKDAAVTDRAEAAAAELYGARLETFTDRRKELAAAAKTVGDKDAATAIAALRKPTRAAWVVNQLARDDPDTPLRLAAMAAALRAAEQARDGPRLRELSRDRGALIDALTGQALAAAGFPDPPSGLRAEVDSTLTAALADPAVAGAFAAGRLTRAEHWSGFGQAGLALVRDAPASPRAPAPPASPAPPAPSRPRRSPGGKKAPAPLESAPSPVRPAARAAAGEDRRVRAAAAEDERRVREAAERADRERIDDEEAERTVAAAATAAAEAVAAEDGLEAEVRDLEERLIRARADLTAARLTARRAEAAERRARQARDRRSRG